SWTFKCLYDLSTSSRIVDFQVPLRPLDKLEDRVCSSAHKKSRRIHFSPTLSHRNFILIHFLARH
ncbi:MAG: hypothetical protein RR960_05660, partial [Alistipes sp.]